MEKDNYKKKEKIAGKTKIIWGADNIIVGIESKPDITAGDGEKKDRIPGKEILANNATCNVFEFLRSKKIKTHFIKRCSEKSFLAELCEMIPVEVVVRRFALGGYLKRHPETPKFFRFKKPVVELFYKSDELHDPYIITQGNQKRITWVLYKANEPLSGCSLLERVEALWSLKEEKCVIKESRKAFVLLEKAFLDLGYILADLKIKFGRTSGKIIIANVVIADVIDNNSWLLLAEEGEHLDKQLYREGKVRAKYEIVSQITNFLKKYI